MRRDGRVQVFNKRSFVFLRLWTDDKKKKSNGVMWVRVWRHKISFLRVFRAAKFAIGLGDGLRTKKKKSQKSDLFLMCADTLEKG